MAHLLPQYDLWEMLGHGGMGAVYKARQISLERWVAVKILPPEMAGEEEDQFIERFKNEARTMARMNHPAIVSVYDFGETADGQLYFVMEYVNGTDVAKMIASQGRLPPEYALAITAHVCDALHYAHTHGVIHRDIKPANILINMEGQVKVADFGLARMEDPSQSGGLTRTGVAMGTPDFVAPEALVIGTHVDGRADLYAIGVMLYNMLTGEVPRGLWMMPSIKLPGLDRRFDGIIARALQTDREMRYQTAQQVRQDLDLIASTPLLQVQETDPPHAQPSSGTDSDSALQAHASNSARPTKRSSLIGPIIASAATIAIGGWLFSILNPKPAAKPAAPAVASPAISKPSPASNPVPAPPVSSPTQAPPPPVQAPPSPGAEKPMPASVATPDPPKSEMKPPGVAAPSPQPAPAAPAAAPVPAPVAVPPTQPMTTPAPATAAAPVAADAVSQRLLALEKQFLAALALQVDAAHQKDVSALNSSYTGALDRALKAATQGGHLDEAVVLREEKQRIAKAQPLPPADLETLPQSLKSMRYTYRQALAKLVTARDQKTLPLYDRYDQELGRYQTELTQQQKIDEALQVKAKREAVAAQRPKVSPAEAPVSARTAATKPANGRQKKAEDDATASRTRSRWQEATRWVISVGGFVRINLDGQMQDVREEKDIPPGKFEVLDISIQNNPKSGTITDEDFTRLSGLKELRTLHLRSIKAGDQAFSFLPGTPALENLVIADAPITDAIIPHLAPLRQLKELQIQSAPQFTGAGFEKLVSLPIMKALWISNTGFTDVGGKALSAAVSLEQARLDALAITDETLLTLAKLPNLTVANFTSCAKVTGSGFSAWEKVSSIKELRLGRTGLQTDTLRHLSRFTNLEILDLDSIPAVTDEALAHLSPLTRLQVISLQNTAITGTGLASLKGSAATLKSLYVHMETPLSSEGVDVILSTFPNLNDLRIGGPATTITSGNIQKIASLKSLTNLEVRWPDLDDAGMKEIGRLPLVTSLYLPGAKFTSAGLAELRPLKLLATLTMHDCKGVDDSAIPVLKDFKLLRDLNLQRTGVTEAGIAELEKALPRCNIAK